MAGLNFNKFFPTFVAMIASAVLATVFVADSYELKKSMDCIQGISLLSKRLRWISILASVVGAILLLALQYISLVINYFWGVYVQITIFFFVMARRHDMKIENLSPFIQNGNKLKILSPSNILALYYRIKLHALATWFLFGNIFLAVAIYIGKKFEVQWEWYDFPGLYLFFVLLGTIFWGILASSGHFISRKY